MPQDVAPRLRIPLRDGWEFARGPVSRHWLDGEGTGEPVLLPHCWNAAEEFQPGRGCYRGPGAYRLAFELQLTEPGTWRLRSGGFYGTGRLRCNGRDAGAFSGDYLGFDADLTARLREGTNRLACRLTNRCGRNVLPGIADPDFLLYGGLASTVWLEHIPQLHWRDEDLRVTCRDDPDGTVEMAATASLVNRTTRAQTLSLHWLVTGPTARHDASPTTLASEAAATLAPGEARLFRLALRWPHPVRWSPETPHLFEGRLVAWRDDGGGHDLVMRTFGVRRLECRPGRGIFLDGRRIFLRGCNRHEQVPGFGNAVPLPFHRLDAQAIRAAGLNFVRLSHYPQSPAFLDACDRAGVLVMPELASWKSVRGGAWLRAARRQFAHLLRRDRHHPSVILWGLGNESRHRRAYQHLDALAKELDPERRPTLYAENHLYRARRSRTLGLTDVWGTNYELDTLVEARAAARMRCVLVTECSNVPHASRGNAGAESEQRTVLSADLTRAEAGADGFALWSFNDYATLRKQRFVRYCGILDGWREPKLAATWLAARANERPVLAVSCDWSRNGPPMRAVTIVTNCAELCRVTLPVWPPPRENGGLDRQAESRPLPLTPTPERFYEIMLPFDGAPLRICGTWYGRRVACCVDPWEAPADLRLSLDAVEHDEGEPTAWSPACERVCLIGVQVVDADGRAVRDYQGDADVALAGPARAALLGGRTLPVRNGTARVIVAQATAQPEPVHIRVFVPALNPRTFLIDWGDTGDLPAS